MPVAVSAIRTARPGRKGGGQPTVQAMKHEWCGKVETLNWETGRVFEAVLTDMRADGKGYELWLPGAKEGADAMPDAVEGLLGLDDASTYLARNAVGAFVARVNMNSVRDAFLAEANRIPSRSTASGGKRGSRGALRRPWFPTPPLRVPCVLHALASAVPGISSPGNKVACDWTRKQHVLPPACPGYRRRKRPGEPGQ